MSERATTSEVLVLQHTHWDREWYQPAGRFRQRLVALVDGLLDEPDAVAPHFLLDGQAVAIEDYLAVRPDRRPAVTAALASGRVEAGPWYVLADELIPGGEALVRNLLAGRAALAALGAAPPSVLYSPDAFGHPAALPALAAGFGCDVIVAWRGYGGARWPAGDAARWRAPDGSTALLYHLPRDGYEFGSNLPADGEAAAERWRRMRDELAPRSRLGLLLVHNGADHHAPQARWRAAFAALARAAAPNEVRVVTLGGFGARAVAAANALPDIPEVTGELRDSYGYTWALQGTFATRAYQKRDNAAVERALVRDVEPWLALLALRGQDLRGGRRALLAAAWRTVLRCHPHDTLCGCSIDAVANAMDTRLASAAAQATGLRADAIAALTGHDADVARERRALWRSVVVVRNRAPRPRGGVAEVELLATVRDVGVGPGSAGGWQRVPSLGATLAVAGHVIQPLERRTRHDRLESARHYPDVDLVESVTALVWVPPVPAYGVVAIPVDTGAVATQLLGEGGAALPVEAVRVAENALDNGVVRVAVDARGRVSVQVPALGIALDDVLTFENQGDAGDLYTHSPVGTAKRQAWCVGVRTVHRGPLRGALEARYQVRVPVGVEPAADGLSRPERRARRHVEIPITARLSLDAGAPFVRVSIDGVNVARDHRLRVVVATGMRDAVVVADAAFGPVERRPIAIGPAERAKEHAPPTAPLHRYVSLYAGAVGATVFSDGLAEYEATANGDVAITLVRAVGELSRPDLPERPGHAGWPESTPDAQCLRPFSAALAFTFHGPRQGAAAEVERLADDVLLPLTGDTVRSALGVAPPVVGAELLGDGLTFAALKPSDDGAWVVARCANVTDGTVDGAWRVAGPVDEACLARLDETPLTALDVESDGGASTVRFAAGARAVVTVLLRAGR